MVIKLNYILLKKEKMKKYISEEILCKLKYYSIYTNAGVIKIIAENDIEIFDTWIPIVVA